MSEGPARRLELGVAMTGLLAAGLRAYTQAQLGFPDGHLTELERALRAPYSAVAALIVVCGVALLVPGRRFRWALVVGVGVLMAVDLVAIPVIGGRLGLSDGGGG
jgi:hypothetical protein